MTLIHRFRQFFETTGTSFKRCCEKIVTPMLTEHGFRVESFHREAGFALTIYRCDDRGIRMHVSVHPYDYPGRADVSLSVGPKTWAAPTQIEVPLLTYINEKTMQNDQRTTRGTYPFSVGADMRLTTQTMCRDLQEFAVDFLRGDLTTYNAVLAKRRF
jgi:hypothetical protein